MSTTVQRTDYNNSRPRGITFFTQYLKILQVAFLLFLLFREGVCRNIIILFFMFFFKYYFSSTVLANSDYLFRRFLRKRGRWRYEVRARLKKNERKWENRRHRQLAMLPRWRCIYFPHHRSGKLLLSPASTDVILSHAHEISFLCTQ